MMITGGGLISIALGSLKSVSGQESSYYYDELSGLLVYLLQSYLHPRVRATPTSASIIPLSITRCRQ